jgi:carbamoyl-phosphate synthase large subunit
VGIIRAGGPDEVPGTVLNEKYLWQECWCGKEFTINFFIGADGRCKCVIPYERVEVRDGEIAKGVTRRLPALEAEVWRMAERLGALGAYGAHCAQAIVRADGEFVIFELNARFGGGYPLADNAGATFSRWLLEDAFGFPSTVGNGWAAGRVMLRYDDAYFYQS